MYNMVKRALTAPKMLMGGTAMALALALAGPAAAQGADATEVAAVDAKEQARGIVEQLSSTLLGVMQQSESMSYEARYEELAPVLKGAFNFRYMAAVSVGRSNWKEMSDEQQTAFADIFTDMSIAQFAARFARYPGQAINVADVAESGANTYVVTDIVPEDGSDVDPLKLNYALRDFDSGLQIYDVLLQGNISQLAQYRAEYSAVYDNQGFDGLKTALQNVIERMKIENS